MPFISFLLISLLFIYYILYKNGKFIWILIVFSTLIGAIVILYQTPAFNQRFVEIKDTPFKPPVGVYHNSTNLRVGILICSFQLLKQNWLLGAGTGDMQVALNSCYEQNGYSDELYIDNYDPHNQFIETWLNVGITGVIILLLTFIIPLRLAIRHKNNLYIFFLLFIMLCCMTESVFNLQKGVVFYSFFNTLFLVYTVKNS
jgi:O-antigen ligase